MRWMYYLGFASALILPGCTDDSASIEHTSFTDDYLPLQIGNYWEFASIDNAATQAIIHREVVDIVSFNEHDYYLLITSTRANPTQKDSAYYRNDGHGNVYLYLTNSAQEENRFKLAGEDKASWSYPYADGSVVTITLTTATLRVGSETITDCKEYYFDVNQWADEEYTVSLAPGIGFVKEYSNAWGLGYVLKAARINGQTMNF